MCSRALHVCVCLVYFCAVSYFLPWALCLSALVRVCTGVAASMAAAGSRRVDGGDADDAATVTTAPLIAVQDVDVPALQKVLVEDQNQMIWPDQHVNPPL